MTAVEFSPQERATLERIEAAQPAPESLRERVAEALYNSTTQKSDAEIMALAPTWDENTDYVHRIFRRLADAALAVIRGES